LFTVYGSYLVFQLSTHASLYDERDIPKSTYYPKKVRERQSSRDMMSSFATQIAITSPEPGNTLEHGNTDEEAVHEEEVEEPQMNLPMTLVALVIITVACKFSLHLGILY
jgi:Ca2+:H+ antiporter